MKKELMTDGEEYIYPKWKKKDCVPFECDNGHTYLVPPKSCYVCGHCDIWWDFTHGPYMFACDKDKDTEKALEGMCESWEPIESEDT